MNWFTKSHELGVFMISFVLVVTGIRGDEENRIDAAQDPFEKVTLADDGGAHSILFGKCLAASRTLEVKLYSIELPSTPSKLARQAEVPMNPEFIRYVPDSSQLAVLPDWKTATSNPPVAKIVDCAVAAHSGGYAMFKYSGGSDCKVSKQSYDLKYTPACDAVEHEAVFILNSAAGECPLPATALVVNEADNINWCITVHTEPLLDVVAAEFCGSKNARMFDGPSGLVGFNDIVKILKDKKVESNNFIVDTSQSPPWMWATNAPVDPALMVGVAPTGNGYLVYMKGSAGFKLDFDMLSTFTGGVVCVRTF